MYDIFVVLPNKDTMSFTTWGLGVGRSIKLTNSEKSLKTTKQNKNRNQCSIWFTCNSPEPSTQTFKMTEKCYCWLILRCDFYLIILFYSQVLISKLTTRAICTPLEVERTSTAQAGFQNTRWERMGLP